MTLEDRIIQTIGSAHLQLLRLVSEKEVLEQRVKDLQARCKELEAVQQTYAQLATRTTTQAP